MNTQKLFFILLLAVFVSTSCNNAQFIKVKLDPKLTGDSVSLVDYDIVLAESDGSDKVHFEWIVNKELDPGTVITFFDDSGNILAKRAAGVPSKLMVSSKEVYERQSFFYSIALDGLHSVSLVKKVHIGGE